MLAAGQRVWLRPRQLPAGAEVTVPEALATMRVAPGTLFSCHGICVAASAPFQVPAARTFQCASCAKVCTLHCMEAPPPCCGGTAAEVEQARVMVPVSLGWGYRWLRWLAGLMGADGFRSFWVLGSAGSAGKMGQRLLVSD